MKKTEKIVQIFDNKYAVVKELKPKKTTYTPLAASNDGKYLLTAVAGDGFKLWDLTGNEKTEILKIKLKTTPKSFAFSSDSKFFAVGGDAGDDAISVYSAETKAMVKKISRKGNDNKLLFSADNNSLYVTDYKYIDEIEISTGTIKQTLKSHDELIKDLALSPDGKWLLTGSNDGDAIRWELAHGIGIDTYSQSEEKKEVFVHQVGEKFGGGLIVHVYRDTTGEEHGLIMALEEFPAIWSSVDKEINTDAISGENATDAIINAGGSEKEAAGICKAYKAGDFSDWHLPSLVEMTAIYKSLGGTSWKSVYWSSTEYDSQKAWGFMFNSGAPVTDKKNNKYMVRPVRTYSITQ